MGALFLGVTSCSEPDDIITSVQYDRLFSPTEIGARVKNRTSVEISWKTLNTSAQQFTVELSTDEDFSTVQHTKNAVASPVLIAGLDGETEYFARVKSAGEGVAESKWSPVVKFKTDSENIFMPAQDGDLQATSVVLRWTPGEVVESIDVLDQENVLVKNQGVTAEECAAGAATITDLQGETTYTMVLKRNGKSRGTITVTTELDLGDAVKVTVEDDWYTLIKNAEANTVFAFMPGEYAAYATESGEVFSNITLASSVSIKAAKSTDKPVLKGFNLKLGAGVSLDLQNVILDGTVDGGAAHSDQAIITGADGAIDHIIITGTEIMNYAKGVIYVNTAVAINTVEFSHCYIHDIVANGGDVFDFRKGAAVSFTFTNNSVVNAGVVNKRDLFRMDAGGNTVVASGTITITNNNFDKVSASGKRILYIRLGDNFPITFTNNVVSNSEAIYTNQKTTKIETLKNNDYFNAANLYTPSETAGVVVDNGKANEDYFLIDPKYNDSYLVTDEDLVYKGIGNF